MGGLRASAEDEWARLRKERARWWVRRLGMLAACGQLGTAFAATRALRTTEARQRLVDMDLRFSPSYRMHAATEDLNLGNAPRALCLIRAVCSVVVIADVHCREQGLSSSSMGGSLKGR